MRLSWNIRVINECQSWKCAMYKKKEYTYILCTYSSSAIALAEERNAATTILHDSKNCSPFCCRFFFREKNRGEKTTRWQIKSEAWKRSITWSWARLYFSSYFWIRNLKGWKEVMYCKIVCIQQNNIFLSIIMDYNFIHLDTIQNMPCHFQCTSKFQINFYIFVNSHNGLQPNTHLIRNTE